MRPNVYYTSNVGSAKTLADIECPTSATLVIFKGPIFGPLIFFVYLCHRQKGTGRGIEPLISSLKDWRPLPLVEPFNPEFIYRVLQACGFLLFTYI